MTIREQLAKIQANRAEKIKTLEERQSEFVKIKEFAFKLKELKENCVWQTMIKKCPKRKEAWQTLLDKIEETDFFNMVFSLFGSDVATFERGGALRDIWERINREYITISVMGPISVGKSLLLQLITGLGDNVIPVSANTCTAACTTFINDTKKEATIEFLSENEVKDILVEHIDLLNAHLKNTNQTRSLSSIITKDMASNISLSTLISMVQDYGYLSDNLYSEHAIAVGSESTLGTSLGYYETVKAYCDNYHNGYSQHIGSQNMPMNEDAILSGELKRYVSYDADGSSIAFAVRKVTIYWPLNLGEENLGQIRLKDTMGVGEAKIGVTKDLVKALRDESDIAIALCSVQQAASLDKDKDTTTFIQVVKDSVKGRKPEEWIYYLLNKYANASIDDVNRVKGQLKGALTKGNVHIDLPENNFSAVDFLLQNGENNYAGIANYFSSVILPNIVQNISTIDNFFVQRANTTLDNVVEAFKEISEMFKSFPIPLCDTDQMINNVLHEVRGTYHGLGVHVLPTDKIKDALNEHCRKNPFGSFVVQSLECEDVVGDPVKLEELITELLEKKYPSDMYANGNAFIVFTKAFIQLKNKMCNSIQSAISNVADENNVTDIKEKIVEIFKDKGKLSELSLKGGSAQEWLKSLVSLLKENEGDYPNLIECLETLIKTDIDQKSNVIKHIVTAIKEVINQYHVFNKTTIKNYDDWIEVMMNCLLGKEGRVREIVNNENEYKKTIGNMIIADLNNFADQTDELMIGEFGLVAEGENTGNYPVFIELKKFYKYKFEIIFRDEEYVKKQDAINKAKTIKENYCK